MYKWDGRRKSINYLMAFSFACAASAAECIVLPLCRCRGEMAGNMRDVVVVGSNFSVY